MPVICNLLPWDSRHFGVTIGKVENHRLNPEDQREIETWTRDNNIECLYLLADPEPGTLSLASRLGFRFIDVRVTLDMTLTPMKPAPHNGIRVARSSDLPELQRIAAESHHDTRFYVDGRFPRTACDDLYRLWIAKGLDSKDGIVFVSDEFGQPTGYNSVFTDGPEGTISLLAVDSRYRGEGVARRLIAKSLDWLQERGVTHITVPTQSSNTPALRLYESIGFKIQKTEVWFHRWR